MNYRLVDLNQIKVNTRFNYPIFLFLLAWHINLFGQEVPILNYEIDVNGQVQLEVASSNDHYYILNVRHEDHGDFVRTVSMTIGAAEKTIISESLEAYPIDHYQVMEYDLNYPIDIDNDGLTDYAEFMDMPTNGPLNSAQEISFVDGAVTVDSYITFKELSVSGIEVPWASFLNNKEFVKFVTIDLQTDNPQIYFVNSETHYRHGDFMEEVGINVFEKELLNGEIVYHPTTIANNGTLGSFSFNFSQGFGEDFETVRKTQELIAANMPFLKNNLSYYISEINEQGYFDHQDLFDESRVSVLFEADIFAEIDYLALNIAEGFGFLRVMELDETPSSRDVVLYESLPNTLPRIGGIITSFIQTPLSHVNLRAIQDKVPNAFIRDPLLIDSISNLVGKYIYYKVDQDEYFMREASIEEVNAWFDELRPEEDQFPKVNLSYTSILPLDSIYFDMSDAFGAKCSNVATMRRFGFPEGTVPDGFGVPFYFYQQFMQYNGFFQDIDTMMANPIFQNDLEYRITSLKNFRNRIKEADMPVWMMKELQDMHELFPANTSVRCRSSTNNEDLPGFSGAGLYTSKTQHQDEGHISKSIKQVYASMWNFRAYDEREFYRVDHFAASMGVLCHANYSNEKANGVGVSTDPIYQTENTFYLNTQLGEDLVTNPDALSVPEEILLDRESVTEDDYFVIRKSNLVPSDILIMEENYLDEMRFFLSTIHDEFQVLYHAEGDENFAMDIEYKITEEGQLIIKQARPWASFWSGIGSLVADVSEVEVSIYPNPSSYDIIIKCDCPLEKLYFFDLNGRLILEHENSPNKQQLFLSIDHLPKAVYVIVGAAKEGQIHFTKKLVKE